MSKSKSLLIVLLSYLFALSFSYIFLVNYKIDNLIYTLLFADIIATIIIYISSCIFKNSSIKENNLVQTSASAGESLAAGIIFTMPALLVMGFAGDMNFVTVFCVAILGGVLGTIFTIALRRVFIVEEALLYPEGIACEEVLGAGETWLPDLP